MTTYWTGRRYVGLAIHAALALLLLIWSTSSSLHFWEFAFTDPLYSFGAVLCIDGIALLGFVLYLARIDSPLAYARHALPLVSALPLVFDMHRQFEHLGGVLTWAFTIGVTALLVALAFIVWRTIEQLFIDPVQAAREYAEQRMQALVTTGEQLQVMQHVADGFVHQHQQRALDAMQLAPPALHAVESYARPADAPMQPVHVQIDSTANQLPGRDTDRLPDLPATYVCFKCQAVNNAPAGKDATALRKASGRYGCPQCKAA